MAHSNTSEGRGGGTGGRKKRPQKNEKGRKVARQKDARKTVIGLRIPEALIHNNESSGGMGGGS